MTETAFYAKLAGRFSGSKTKVTSPIASKFGTNIQLINLKLLSKFHAARPNRSRVISKSSKFRTRWLENGRVKTERHATRASVVPITNSRRRRGAVALPIRFKTSKILANSLFIWANSLFIWAHHWQKTVSVKTVQILVKTFFLFFFFGEHLNLDRKTVQILVKTFFFILENILIWAEKTVSILAEKRNASSHFSGKSLVPPQIILSSYGHAITELIFGHKFVFFSGLVLTSDHFSGSGLYFTTLVRFFQPLSRKPKFGQTLIIIITVKFVRAEIL